MSDQETLDPEITRLEARTRTEAERSLEDMGRRLQGIDAGPRVARVGRVVSAGDGVAHAQGLDRPLAGELLDVGGVDARVEAIHETEVQLVQLSPGRLEAGAVVRRSGRVLDVPAGTELIGRILDPTGRPIDGQGPLANRRRVPVESPVVPLVDREPVCRPLRTGVFVVDTMVPVGLGQRQLIVGDRGTGKTELALDVLAALEPGLVGVYVAIGRRGSETAGHLEWLRKRGFFERGLAVVADADDPVGMVHLAPYAGCAIAEDLALSGRDVVIVYDDLTSHAHAHRTLALLLGRPVGREAFPVDVFYAHARLLERATQFADHRGGGSLTALPIVETQSGDLSAYVPTNIVSITDGQLRLDASLVAAGQIPAVDVGLSVSRVGGKAQPRLVRRLGGSLKNDYALFLELEAFARFGTRLESSAEARVTWGRRVREVLAQPRGAALGWAELVARLLLLGRPELAQLPAGNVDQHVRLVFGQLMGAAPELLRRLERGESLEGDEVERLSRLVAASFERRLGGGEPEAPA